MAENSKKVQKKLSIGWTVLAVTAVMMIILNGISWISPSMADFHMKYIFPAVSIPFSYAVGILPFSLGEVLIVIGVLLLLAAPVLFIVLSLKKRTETVKKAAFFYCSVLTFILVTETMNCFILYHTSEFSDKYHHSAGKDGFTSKQLITLCEEMIAEANDLSAQVNRNSEGDIILPDDLRGLCEESFERLSTEYPELAGRCPQPKRINASMLMTQFDLQGVYFPFSMEANFNPRLSPARTPCTVIHELSHLKGFIREDEAGFIAYRACSVSGNTELRYSGTLSAMGYLLNAVYSNASREEYSRLASMISDNVRKDNIFVSEEFKKLIEEKSVIPTAAANAVSEKAIDTTLILNGVSDGSRSYGRMVDLLLEYRFYISRED